MTAENPTEDEHIEQLLEEMFEKNFERLKYESGHGLAPEVKRNAFQQVLLYWRKLREIAETITDTEVKLNLANQITPRGHKFGIEGVVDIVREQARTVMYDIKTHDLEAVWANLESYERQLNVYAYIWKNLRGESLDETDVIVTQLPVALQQALELNDHEGVTREMLAWNPVVPIQFDKNRVDETIHAFGEVVDDIEQGCFEPPDPQRLGQKDGRTETFATRVCLNCDARFACNS